MVVKQDLAMVFPGQGSQSVGMLLSFADSDIVKKTFRSASEVLGYDLWSLIQSGDPQELNMTQTTQPALLTSSVALWRLWQERGGATPRFMAGHSLGEWSALVCSGAVDFEAAVRLVRLRGQYMQEAVPVGVGSMAAILGLPDDKVQSICEQVSVSGVVAPANYNSPGQLVIAGESEAVSKAMDLCKQEGAKRALLLPVSAPFHTSLMKPAAERLVKDLEGVQFSRPEIPVVHNVTALPQEDSEVIKGLMIEQICSPVRWVECVQYLSAHSAVKLVEVGPGKVLSGLSKRIDKALCSSSTESLNSFEASMTAAAE